MQKLRPLRQFDETEHKLLNTELKYLYTAITRARCNLWIYDCDPDKCAPMYCYFQKRGLVTTLSAPDSGKDSDSIKQILTPKFSSVEEWMKKGDEFRNNRLWDMAIFCYAEAGMDELVQETKAYSNMCMANTMHKEQNSYYLKASLNFLRLFDIQPSEKWIEKAAMCLLNACKYELAASLFLKLHKVKILTMYMYKHLLNLMPKL